MGYVLTEKARLDVTPSSYIYNIFAGSAGIVAATTELNAVTFNGTSLVKTGESTISGGYSISSLTSDGTYFYAISNGVMTALSMINGVPTKAGTAYTLTGLTNVKGMVCDSLGYIYVASTQGITAFSFNGSLFTNRATVVCDQTINLCTNGTYIFACTGVLTNNYVKAFSFNGSSFTACGSYLHSSASKDVNCAYHDGTYLVIGDEDGVVTALSHDGANFAAIGSVATGKNITSMDGDGYFIYVVSMAGPITAIRRTGSTLAIVSTIIDSLINNLGSFMPRAISVRAPYIYYFASDNVRVARMDLTAQFTADKLTGVAPLTVNFTAV
jgi:hypothetical protein